MKAVVRGSQIVRVRIDRRKTIQSLVVRDHIDGASRSNQRDRRSGQESALRVPHRAADASRQRLA